MQTAWYIVPYKRRVGLHPVRYCAMDDYSTVIFADGGDWLESEVLGNRAIVKVKASPSTLDMLNTVTGFKRLPKDNLGDSLKDIPPNIKQSIRAELMDAGYTAKEINSRFKDDLSGYTLRDVLRFLATRRKKPRYDKNSNAIIFDGVELKCTSIEELDGRIK